MISSKSNNKKKTEKTTIHNSFLVSLLYITSSNLFEDILSFTRMFATFNRTKQNEDTMFLPMFKDNDMM